MILSIIVINMARINMVIDDEVYRKFLEAIILKYGKWKGFTKTCFEEALLMWAEEVKKQYSR